MKRFIVRGCVGVAAALVFTVVALKGAQKPAAPGVAIGVHGPATRPMGKLIVHEWGTFTGFAGSDGIHLPFKTLVGSDLPPFVMNRLKQRVGRDPMLNFLAEMVFAKAGGAAALQRMETPVIYFYADAAGEADVRVDFPNGLLTEFYPPVRSMAPKFGVAVGEAQLPDDTSAAPAAPPTQPSMGPYAESFLDWGRVRIVPHPSGEQLKAVPAVTGGGHYGFARDADSSLIEFTDASGEKHEEKFLFYRGLGNFKLPVTLAARGGDRFELRNAATSPVGWAFLIQVDADAHTPPRFARFEGLAGNQELALPPGVAVQGDLAASITSSLVSSGLFEKEARAMVQTWKSSWLDEPGTRVLYIVPRPVTDALLPLRVHPSPDQTVRVLVGRIDVLTPEQESRLRSMMLAANQTTRLSAEQVRMLSGLGRFLNPALDRVSKLGDPIGQPQVDLLRDALSRSAGNRK